MSEPESQDSAKRKLENRLKRLVRHIQNIEDHNERQASIAFCIANLILENCDEIEGLGLLEKVKTLLGEICKPKKASHQLSKLPYIS